MENTIKQLKRMRSKSDTPNHEFITCFQSDKKDWTDIGIMQIFLFYLLMLKPNDPVLFWATSEDWLHYTPFFFWLSIRLNPAHLCNCEDSLSTRHHLVPLVMQHVHVAVRLVTADEFRYVGGERWVLGQSDPVTWGGKPLGQSKSSKHLQNKQNVLQSFINLPVSETLIEFRTIYFSVL